MKKTISHKLSSVVFLLLLTLLALLPFHAFGVTFLNTVFFDSTTSPPLFLRLWKEAIIFILIIIFIFQFFQKKQKISFNYLDYLIIGFFLWGIFSAVFITQNIQIAIFGAKYDFEFLVLYLIIKQFQFSKTQIQKIIKIVLSASIIVIIFAILQKFILPDNFLEFFGYSPDHSHFSPNKPLAYCQKISGTETCRIQSFLAGPNQLGSYLLIIIALFFTQFFCKQYFTKTNSLFAYLKKLSKSFVHKQYNLAQYKEILFFILSILVLIFTYSRASWLGFGIMILATIILIIKNKKKLWYGLSSFIVVGLITVFGLMSFAPNFFHKVVFRPSSTQGHFERMADGVNFSLENPWGLGLGNAGPASNHFAKDYLGFIPESWYLQVSLELGIVGILIYLSILFFALYYLFKELQTKNILAMSLFLSLIGFMIASFFLHTWEDSTTALTFWGLMGLTLNKNTSQSPLKRGI